MDGAVVAGELERVRVRGGQRSPAMRFSLALAEDDAGIRTLLRDTPMQGEMRLSLEREPSAFAADAIEGDFHQTLVAKDAAGRIVAMGGRSIREAYVNGRAARLGYLGQLRIAPGYRGRDMLLRGYELLRELHADGRTPFYLTSILLDNLPARRLLEANLRGMPTYHPLEEWLTFVIPTRRRLHLLRAQPASSENVDGIAKLLARRGMTTQFTPVWGRESISGSAQSPELNLGDFVVVEEDGLVKGCAAVWDQRRMKQVVVRGYSGRLGRWRWAINRLAFLTGWPALPRVGREVSQAYLSHLAVEADDVDRSCSLIAAARLLAAKKGCDYLVVGLASRHPLVKVIKRVWKHRCISSMLYAVHWEDGRADVEALDGRMPHVEVATL